MQSAEASIVGFLAGQAEEIALTYQLPDFTYQVREHALTCDDVMSRHKAINVQQVHLMLRRQY